ncbi:MAG: oxalyl-CoA decarboxylase, partial [Burkholderiales bacterium]
MAVTTENRPALSPASSTEATAQTIDGFQLVIEALKLNGLDTVYGLPGIPITDPTRRAQADGLR